MPDAQRRRSAGPHASCVCCGKPVARMHGLVVLLRKGKRGVSFRLTTAGYCAAHRDEAIDAALAPFEGRGQIVAVSAPELVRPSREWVWRRSTVERLTAAAEDLVRPAGADQARAYPDEPRPDSAAGTHDESGVNRDARG